MSQLLSPDEREEIEIEVLLHTIYRISGFDYRGYTRSSILRRTHNRLHLEQLPSISALTEKVLHEEGFLEKVLNDYSINVTEMFRDPAFFASFRTKVVPIIKSLPEIRIWHAGCSTGEEAYSMAILLDEEGLYDKAKIYATDINERVLNIAEKGIIELKRMKSYTKNYLQSGGKKEFSEYYDTDHEHAYLKKHLLQNMIFAQHNLVTDSSFNEFHVIICRNVMIYFNAELQKQVYHLFYSSLGPNGFLGLGNKESLRPHQMQEKFFEFDGQERIYQKK